jgi:hypothetical protein
MIKLFNRIFWHNNTTPAINEDNLNAMSKAIDDIDNRVIELGADVLEVVPQIQTYLDQAEDLYEAMENLSKHPPYIGANGNWYVWDTETSAFVDSGIDASITVDIADITMLDTDADPYVTNTGTDTDPVFHLFIPRGATGATGQPGPTPNITMSATVDANTGTPSVTVTKSGTAENPVYTFTFTNLKGQTGATGATGQTGPAGADGVSPSVTIASITGGHRVTITDATHPSGQSFDVMNGSGTGDMLAAVYDPQSIVANKGGIVAYAEKKATVLNKTLAANATSVTFTGIPTSGNFIIDFYIDGGANYTAINTATSGQVTLTYDAESSARTVYCEIKEVS